MPLDLAGDVVHGRGRHQRAGGGVDDRLAARQSRLAVAAAEDGVVVGSLHILPISSGLRPRSPGRMTEDIPGNIVQANANWAEIRMVAVGDL